MNDDAGRRLLRQLEAAQRLARMGSFEHDLRTGQSTWSPMMYELHGVGPDYVPAASASEYAKLVHPDDLPGLISASDRTRQSGEVSDVLIRVRHGAGWRRLRVLFQCERAADGTPLLLSGTMQDVTGEVDARAKTRFLTRVTHELRAPLAGVIGMIDLALADSTPEARADHLGSARASARHLLELIDDLLDASREDTWRINVVEIEFDLAEVVAQAVAMMVPRARRKRLRLAGTVADGVATRRVGDPLRLRQILVNLLYNAVKFTGQGAVEARALPGTSDDEVALVVEDTGVGIAPELQAAVFEPYVQGDQPSEGVGLGLAITRELVSALGGSIDLTSTPGVGTCFTVRLPLRRVAGDSRRSDRLRAIDQPSSPGAPGESTPVSPLRILVADDNPTSAAIVQAILERGGHAVVWVTDGEAAVAAAGAARFDVVLMDIEMPRLDGLGAARALRAAEHSGNRPRVPVIAMSAHRDLELPTAQAGMDAYLTKPVGADALARVLSGVAAGDVRGPIDHAARLSRVGGRAELGRTVIATFLGHAPRLIDPIDEALGQASAVDLRRAAHGLRGALAMVGAQRAADLAALIEEASLAEATRLRDRLAIELARVTAELELVRDLSAR